jgi:glycosyltransferase involved in cell wall biosynthesis
VAADVFVFHAQSKSYSHERRLELAERANTALSAKHDPATHIWPQVGHAQRSLAMVSVRARTEAAIERYRLIEEGRRRWQGLRLGIVLPALSVGGGANVLFQEARALRRMGVDVWFINLDRFVDAFPVAYPDFDLEMIYARGEDDVARVAADPVYGFDVVVASFYKSVFWLPEPEPRFRRAYYIQDYEPLFFAQTDPEQELAFQSYQHADDIQFLTKTNWNADQVQSAAAPRPAVVGASVDVDRFQPAPVAFEASPGPVRVCAMVRPSSPRRGPERTLQVLRRLKAQFGPAVDIVVFGTSTREPENAAIDFTGMTNLGEIPRAEVAAVLRGSDVFLDYSDYQAMGLTALEAMCSGCAVVLPVEGGAGDFARDEVNSLMVDTTDADACWRAAERLIADGELRGRLQRQGIVDANALSPETAAFRMMEALFGGEGDGLAASAPHP